MKLFFDDTEFDAQFARTVGKAAVGTADVGEVLRHGQPRDRGRLRQLAGLLECDR